MATHTNVIASWENNYADAEKSLKTLVTTLALAASGKPELEQQLKTETEQRAMWQDLFVDARTEMNRLKVDHSILLEQNAALAHDKEQAEVDRIKLLEDLARMKKEFGHLAEQHNSSQPTESSFSVLLIDGDGLIFDTFYLKKGAEGGREAALVLRNGLTERFSLAGPHVRIFVYLNKLGLSRALMEVRFSVWQHIVLTTRDRIGL